MEHQCFNRREWSKSKVKKENTNFRILLLCAVLFASKHALEDKEPTLLLLKSRLLFHLRISPCFIVLSFVCVHVCKYVLFMCIIIGCVRLKLYLGGGNSTIRYVTQGGAKLKRYVLVT